MTQTTTSNPSPSNSPTPVANTPKSKVWATRLLAAFVAVVVLYAIFHAGRKPETKADTQQQVAAPTVDAQAPQLPLNPQQVERIKAAVQQLQNASANQESEEAQKLEKMREVAPVQVYSSDGGFVNGGGAATTIKGNPGDNAVLGGDGSGDANTQFMAKVSNSQAPIANATHIAHPATTLAQGTMIWATLETRVVSDLPGMVRAVTSEDIYSEEGSQVLLPKGSRLIGQYTNAINQGQNRVFVVWQRVIRPDHIDIQLSSPGTDQLGATGVGADGIDHHFIAQFGTAALLSIIGAGAANMGVDPQDQLNSSSAYREALGNSFAQSAQNTLQSTGVIKPTLYINQGTKISVFVARDLDFYTELQKPDSDNSF